MRLPRCGVVRVLAATLFAVVVSTSAFAVTKNWVNTSADGNWGTASNWSPAGVPTSVDDVVVGSDQTAGNVLVNVNASVNTLNITNPFLTNPKLTVQGVTLTIAANSSVDAGTKFALSGGIL